MAADVRLEQGLTLSRELTGRSRIPDALLEIRCNMWDPSVIALCMAVPLQWMLGYPDRAFANAHEALRRALKLSHPLSLAHALHGAATIHWLRREWQAAQDHQEGLIALATEHGFASFVARGTFRQGQVFAARGQWEAGIEHMQRGLAALRATGEPGHPMHLALLAAVHGQGGHIEAGFGLLTQALTMMDETGERAYEAEIRRLLGDLLLLPGSRHKVEEAEASLLHALDIARRQQAKSWELRVAMSLGRLWQQQGRGSEAREVLADLYGWFTEGFDNADLQEAKALLEALGT